MASRKGVKERAELTREARLRRQMAILLDFARIAAEATDRQRMFELACEHAARATGVEHSKVLEYRSEKAELEMVAGKGWEPAAINHAIVAIDMRSPAGRAYQTRSVVRSGNLAKDPELRQESILRDHNILSVVNAPIAIDGVVWGILEIDSTSEDAFTEDDEQFLLAFALVLALAVRNRIALVAREQDAAAAGRQKLATDLMLREQNHRVRNYFQMILTIISARSAAAQNERERTQYVDLMERVAAIGLTHDLLAIEGGQSLVNAAIYLEALCAGLERTLGHGPKISRDFETIQLRPDRAVPLGLIANELLTNCFKYAEIGRPDAVIAIRLCTDIKTGQALLRVTDNGPGFDGKPQRGQGLRLIRSIAGQLSGKVEIESSEAGTVVTLSFPMFD